MGIWDGLPEVKRHLGHHGPIHSWWISWNTWRGDQANLQYLLANCSTISSILKVCFLWRYSGFICCSQVSIAHYETPKSTTPPPQKKRKRKPHKKPLQFKLPNSFHSTEKFVCSLDNLFRFFWEVNRKDAKPVIVSSDTTYLFMERPTCILFLLRNLDASGFPPDSDIMNLRNGLVLSHIV